MEQLTMSAPGESRQTAVEEVSWFCDGFRMPANADLSTGTRAGVRKPPNYVASRNMWRRGRSMLALRGSDDLCATYW
jgi:hypothetical protein